MDLCVSELEEVSREPQHETPKAIVQESPHPYPSSYSDTKTIRLPGAEALIVSFDPRCSTERRHDALVIKDGGGAAITVRSGRDAQDWTQEVRVVGDELTWTFKSDGSANGWGFMFTIQPQVPKKSSTTPLLSDRALQSRPSINLVTYLLNFQLGQILDGDTLSRLGAALASCAQLNALDASQRMWAIQHLRKLIDTASNSVCLVCCSYVFVAGCSCLVLVACSSSLLVLVVLFFVFAVLFLSVAP
jgi:E3 ubiquitin-protein ligase HERC2